MVDWEKNLARKPRYEVTAGEIKGRQDDAHHTGFGHLPYLVFRGIIEMVCRYRRKSSG